HPLSFAGGGGGKAVDLAKNLQDELTCCLCLDFFNKPVLIIKCSHSFCKECISEHCKKMGPKALCPRCRGELRQNNLVDHRSLANIVETYQQMKKNQQELLGPSWREHPAASGSQDLKLSAGVFPYQLKTTSSEQEVSIGEPIRVTEVVLGVQKISGIVYAVEEFRRQLDRAVLEKCPRPQPRGEWSLKFSTRASYVTFDPKTISNMLQLTADKRKVSVTPWDSDYEYCPKRFRISQVLGSQSFSEGCHYWEVSTRNSAGWAIGVASEDIGKSDKLGRSEVSWCIEWSRKWLSAWHRNQETPISKEKPLQVGVLLDIPSNRLSFYSLTDKVTLLHQFEIHVVNPVYPAFWIYGTDIGGFLTINDIKRN
uniref:Uncharacterized protein n=1 Tax=Podarcis muralis TaxID=64176 RepID=A0A670HK12_PODMU